MPPGIESEQIEQIDRIYGEALIKLFRELIEDKTLLRVFLLGKDYERLTIATGLEQKEGEFYVTVDYPGGFKEAIQGTEDWRLRFEFTGKDKIPYIFRTEGGELIKQGVRLKLPRFIERRQRRRSFRLEAPLGTTLVFTKDFKEYVANVLNISLGGAFVSLEKGQHKKPVLEIDEYLKGVKVTFRSKEKELTVHIKEAMVKRVEKDIYQGRLNYALQFTDMEKKNSYLLQKLIFQFQREYLRKTRLIDS